MSYSPASLNGQDAIFTATAVTAAVAAVGLAAAQSDIVSRRILSHDNLQAKRLREYSYRWEQAIDKMTLRCQYYLAGGIDAVHGNETRKQSTSKSNPSTTMIWDEDGLKELIQEWMTEDKKHERESREKVSNESGNHNSTAEASSPSSPFPRILGFSREEDSREVLIDLINPVTLAKFELPLAKFGSILAEIFEGTLTSTALCFVADASSGLGTTMIADILDASKAGVVRCIYFTVEGWRLDGRCFFLAFANLHCVHFDVLKTCQAIIREPTWMVAFASLVGERVISQDKMQRILFGLCRMEALRVREQVGEYKEFDCSFSYQIYQKFLWKGIH